VFFNPGDRIFVDESKNKKYVVAATSVPPDRIQDCQKTLRGLLLPGQTRLHFTREGDRRRKVILAEMAKLDVWVGIWQVAGLREREARRICLTAVVEAAFQTQAESVIFERDESLERSDRRLVFELSQRFAETKPVPFRHSDPQEQPLLWVSDAVAWCYSRGGDWTRRVSPLVGHRVVY
jgi:hypothetical protein